MIELKINVENENVADAVKGFFVNYKEVFMEYLTQFIKGVSTAQGLPPKIDPGVTLKDEVITIYQIVPDKGAVLGEVKNGEYQLQLIPYSALEDGKRYVIQEKDRLKLFWKQPDGEADITLGMFKDINDAVTQLDCEGVLTAMKNAEDYKKALAKANDRADRLAHPRVLEQGAEEAVVVEEPVMVVSKDNE